MKTKLFMIFISLFILTFGVSSAQVYPDGLALASITGGQADLDRGLIKSGESVPTVFNISINNEYDDIVYTVVNGFRVYSNDGATWTTTTIDTVYDGFSAFFAVPTLGGMGVDGGSDDADTITGDIVFAAMIDMGYNGLPADFDAIAYAIAIGPIDGAHDYKHICLDSAFFPPGGDWLWDYGYPTWDGSQNDGGYCFEIRPTLGVEALGGNLPANFALGQNYPNPFNPSTEIKFDLPKNAHISIDVFNVLGQKVRTLLNEEKAAGSYKVDWDGTNDNGASVSSGVYFYKMQTDSFVETKKMMLVK